MILQKENKILRGKAKNVDDPKSSEIKALIKKMAEAMFAEPDGIGIAAPQVGAGLRIFLVAKDVIPPLSPLPARPARLPIGGQAGGLIKEGKGEVERRKQIGFLVFINPVLKKTSSKKNKDTEGCLSVRGYYGEVARPEKMIVEYLDENGKKHTRGASGLLARVIQHELDHLEGILFTDKV